jgi:hypothetical protein
LEDHKITDVMLDRISHQILEKRDGLDQDKAYRSDGFGDPFKLENCEGQQKNDVHGVTHEPVNEDDKSSIVSENDILRI